MMDGWSPPVGASVRIRGACSGGRPRNANDLPVGPIDLDVAAGEFTSLLCPRGCGSSTLLRMIAGLVPPVSGTVHASAGSAPLRRTQIGYVFPAPLLLPRRTVLENVLLEAEIRGLRAAAHRERARRLLAEAGLAGAENSLPRQLTHADAQRLCVCRALLPQPELLLLDSLFQGMDELTLENFVGDLQRLWLLSPTTVIMATGQMVEAVVLSDRVLVMAQSPARIVHDHAIPLPRPRRPDKETLPRVSEHAARIRTILQAQGVLF
ncbi:MAG: ABC transporter ATP-binding protein [Acidobacteria bacterium]|nr:ABC transporter ATP-binding protein [Acidobacteriota bacterium]